jgi:hypothetical protein
METFNGYKIGDVVYYKDEWTGMIEKAVILNIKQDYTHTIYAELKNLSSLSNTGQKIINLSSSYEEACEKREEDEEILKSCENKISSVDELIQFMYKNMNTTNEEVLKIVKNKSKELLDLDLHIDNVNIYKDLKFL